LISKTTVYRTIFLKSFLVDGSICRFSMERFEIVLGLGILVVALTLSNPGAKAEIVYEKPSFRKLSGNLKNVFPLSVLETKLI
jgi:hypothetical protein